jgi:hypothetical protein
MASDNLLRFSQVIKNLSDEEWSWFERYMVNRCKGLDVDGEPREVDEEATFPDFEFHLMDSQEWGKYAWFVAREGGNVGQVAEVVQDFLRTFRPSECFTLTWAEYCTISRPGEFDGGAIFVSASRIDTFHAGEWAYEKERGFQKTTSETPHHPT